VQYSKTIVHKAAVERKAFLSHDVSEDQELRTASSVMALDIRSVMCVPLLARDMEVLGVIELDSHSERGRFTVEDMEILACVANQASILVEQAKLHREMVKQAEAQRDLTLAQQVQESFLPATLPQLEEYSFWAYYQAARAVGGDFYDCIPLAGGEVGIVLGDVAGKGIPAALMMAKLSALCRQLLLSSSGDVAAVMNALNKEVCDIGLEGKFVTIVLCVLDPKNHEIRGGVAGHMPPMIRRADLAIDESLGYRSRGLPLGLERDQEYHTERTHLGPGDLVVLFTDGISDAMNSKAETYSVQRVREQLIRSGGKDPAETGRLLLEDVSSYLQGCEQTDDTCLLIFQRDPRSR
jgi:serine phosphatase RsbU (regulator of sigma subunit)